MRTLPLVFTTLLGGWYPGRALAQRPDFAATWVAVPAETPRTLPAAPSPVLGARFALAMDGNVVVMTRPVRDLSVVSRLPLGGGETTTPVPGRMCEGERQLHEVAAMDGEALILTTLGQTAAGSPQRRAGQNRSVLRLEGTDRLVVEGTMVQGGQSRQVGSVYRRTNDALPPVRPTVAGPAATIAQLGWLGASWSGTTGPVTTEERWTPAASGGMIAVARTLRGDALAAFEFLCIVERGGTLAYLAMPDGRMPPTVFTLTTLTPTSATFENPAHDFPKMVRYALSADGHRLETTIAGANGARAQTVSLTKQ